MKKKCSLLLVLAISISLISPMAFAQTYTITQLVDNTHTALYQDINDSGQVAWCAGGPGSDTIEIFRYDGSTTDQISENSYIDVLPQINVKGDMVWMGGETLSTYEIFLYNATTGTTTQLTNNSYEDSTPHINAKGQVVWIAKPPDGTDHEIFLYDGTTTIRLTDNDVEDYGAQVNDLGQVFWIGLAGFDWEIFRYDNGLTTNFTNNSYQEIEFALNSSGQVAWVASDYNDWEIFFYDGTTKTRLTTNSYTDRDPQINDSGYVVWSAATDANPSGPPTRILLYNGTETIELPSTDDYNMYPQINDNGYVVWQTGSGESPCSIFLYDGTNTIRITDDSYKFPYPQISTSGDVVWAAWGPSGISGLLASPDYGNTPSGTEVVVVEYPLMMTFDQVTTAGETTLTTSAPDPGSVKPPPKGFRIGNPPTYYEVSTTAEYTGSIEVCIDYSGASYGNENNLRIFHDTGDGWDDVTFSLDKETKTICALVESFSYVAIFEPTILAPEDPVSLTDPVVFTAEIYYSGSIGNLSATCGWGDDSTSAGTVVESSPESVLVTCTRAYSNAGVYTVDLTVSGNGSPYWYDSYQYVVVYDPEGAFVTGGGWINSPEGAFGADPTLTGKANFGFVSKYKQGTTEPIGETEFQFKVADLDFHSDTYEWLVVAGARAQYKGTGTINGEGNFGFMLKAIDENLTPSTDVDLFRIKIWDRFDDAVIYDNQMGTDEDVDPSTGIGGGSIVIHTN
jgi:hypothetical protein